jgi:hypothetical protein
VCQLTVGCTTPCKKTCSPRNFHQEEHFHQEERKKEEEEEEEEEEWRAGASGSPATLQLPNTCSYPSATDHHRQLPASY